MEFLKEQKKEEGKNESKMNYTVGNGYNKTYFSNAKDNKGLTRGQSLNYNQRNSNNLLSENGNNFNVSGMKSNICLLYTSPSPRDLSTSRMPSSA